MKVKILIILFNFYICLLIGQDKKKDKFKPYKIGFLINYATNENFINDDPDYDYTTKTYKGQVFYDLGQWKSFNIELIVQPQIQFLKHQLLNSSFITPDQDNVIEKIAEFTQLKSMHLYGFEFGFAARKKLFDKLVFQGTISLGFNYIDTRTERLAKGFTFIENFSLGFSYELFRNSHLYIGSNLFGHVSNLNFQKPNDGYNVLGVEIGYSLEL